MLLSFCYQNDLPQSYVEIQVTMLLTAWAIRRKKPQRGWLKRQTFIFSQFWSLEVLDHGSRKPAWSYAGESAHCNLHMPSLLSDVSSCENTNPIMGAPPSRPHLTLMSSQRPFSKYHHSFNIRILQGHSSIHSNAEGTSP